MPDERPEPKPEKPEPKLVYDPTTDPKFLLQTKKMSLEAGWLGRVVGSAKNAPTNITFLVVALVLIAGLGVALLSPQDRLEFWKIILPVLTLALGYVFGQKSGG
jgi:hypothetical protein